MTGHEKIAAEIFRQYGLTFKTAKRAGGGWTNTVWLNGDIVLRLSQKVGSDKLRRETQLAQLFPPSAGYPPNLGTGVLDGYEWSVSKRVQGMNLSRVWKSLNRSERIKAIRQIFDMMHAVHT